MTNGSDDTPAVVGIATSSHLDPVSDDQALVDALARLQIPARVVGWDDPSVAWDQFEAVVVRTTWEYERRRDEFLAWAQAVEEHTALYNPAEVIRWNTHKGYLMELEERGVPTVPTAWLGRGDDVDLHMLAHSRGWDGGVVVKPAVGAGSRGLTVVDSHPGDGQSALDALLLSGDAMVQPMLARVLTDGERSLICVDGRFSHAVRDMPRHGSLGAHVTAKGSQVADNPTDDLVALAEWVVDVTGHDLLYARVDLVPADDGTWQVGELEVTEPHLFLDRVEGAADRFAKAIEARLA